MSKPKPTSPGAALAALRSTYGGPPKVIRECPKCKKMLSARQMRRACPDHGTER